MKKIHIPQEKNDAQNGQRKVMYAPNNNGEFSLHKYGSEVEEYATKLAVNEYEILKEEALVRIKNGLSSPIEYYMYKSRMDLGTLASITGFFQFNIKRHLKIKTFSKLSEKVLAKYADAFDIEVENLKDFKND